MGDTFSCVCSCATISNAFLHPPFVTQYAPGGTGADTTNGLTSSKMREDLAGRWNELKTPLADRVDCLSAMLDTASASPEMVSRYEAVVEKLAARQPIVQVKYMRVRMFFELNCGYLRIGNQRAYLTSLCAQLPTYSKKLLI